jgi:succinate-acetate transporter protein
MLFMAIIALRISSLLVIWMVSFSIALGFTGAWMMLGSPGITDPSLPISNPIIKISGRLFLACGIAMLYIGFAGLINTIAGRIVLPLGHPLIKQPCPTLTGPDREGCKIREVYQ